MKRLDHCVNIVPIIAKSDTLTVEEREAFKQRVCYYILVYLLLYIQRESNAWLVCVNDMLFSALASAE